MFQLTVEKTKVVLFKTAPAKGDEQVIDTLVAGCVPRDNEKDAALSSTPSVIVNAVGEMTIDGVSLSTHVTISLIAPFLTKADGPEVTLCTM